LLWFGDPTDIHIANEHPGSRVAAIRPIVENCRRLKVPVRDYLAAILPELANIPFSTSPTLRGKSREAFPAIAEGTAS